MDLDEMTALMAASIYPYTATMWDDTGDAVSESVAIARLIWKEVLKRGARTGKDGGTP